MTISDLIVLVQSEVRRFPFLQEVVVVDQTDYATKLFLPIRHDLFAQIYANVQTGSRGYTLIYRNQRIYGRDRDVKGWHRHSRGEPDNHDFSPEGQREVTVTEFLEEVQDLLEEEGLL